MVTPVRKAVIPAAGLGTRFLPATKAQPKEMIPLVDKPAIQYVVEEAVEAGITDILIITSPSKRALEDHFDRNPELEEILKRKGKTDELQQVRDITDLATFHFTRQGAPLGLGHAVLQAERHIGDEAFAVLLPDEIMVDRGEPLTKMIETHVETRSSVVGLREVSMTEISSYGCPAVEQQGDDGVVKISAIVEKPPMDEAPSNLAVMGRYVFTPDLFRYLHDVRPGVGGEIQLTDAMAQLATSSGLLGRVIDAGSYDAGQKLDYLRATVELGLQHDELGADFAVMLKEIVGRAT
ncbi:MAG: UTP--glucose-1-phosphate uridylyltransferase GalU [Acidimicrobiales bacterium]